MMHFFLILAIHTAVPRSVILGNWCAGSKNAFHEEFQLEKSGQFHSWLHQRPALEGTWDVKDRTLTIRGANGDTMIYNIIKGTRSRLVMREKNERHRETYVRPSHCTAFEAPPKDR